MIAVAVGCVNAYHFICPCRPGNLVSVSMVGRCCENYNALICCVLNRSQYNSVLLFPTKRHADYVDMPFIDSMIDSLAHVSYKAIAMKNELLA